MNLFLYVNLVETYYNYHKQRLKKKKPTSFRCFTLEVTLSDFFSDHRKSILQDLCLFSLCKSFIEQSTVFTKIFKSLYNRDLKIQLEVTELLPFSFKILF